MLSNHRFLSKQTIDPKKKLWYYKTSVIRVGCRLIDSFCLYVLFSLYTGTITNIAYPEHSSPPPAPPPPPSNTRTLEGFTDALAAHDMMNGY